MTTNVDMVRDVDEFDEPLFFGRLLELAQNVLSGRGEQGLLGGIEGPDRIRFASALWLEGADGDSSDFWIHNLCNILCDNGIDPARIEIDDDSICPCGHRLAGHSNGRFQELAGKSRAWHVYLTSLRLDARVRTFRAEAVAQHPLLMDHVLHAAHDARGSASRRSAAWQVLEAIDQRQPLIEALARFFRVGPAAIRAVRQWRPESPQHWLTYPTLRRLANMLAAMPFASRQELDIREYWRWLLVADVVVRCTGVTPDYVLRNEFLDGVERLLSVKQVKRQHLQRTLRHTIRWLRLERRQQGVLPRPSRLLAAIGIPAPQPAVLDFCFSLPGGWLAASLESPEALREEGAAMQHCLGRYVKEVMRGDASAYTLRSSDGSERATLMTEPRAFDIEGGEALHITLKGVANGPVHIGAMEAAVALIRVVTPTASRVEV